MSKPNRQKYRVALERDHGFNPRFVVGWFDNEQDARDAADLIASVAASDIVVQVRTDHGLRTNILYAVQRQTEVQDA